MPEPLTAAEMAALSSITERADAINVHMAALRVLAGTRPGPLNPVPSIPPAPIERVPLNPVPMRDPLTGAPQTPIRSLIGEPMQQQPSQITKPLTALDLARYQVPPGVEIKPDHGS